MDLRGGNRLRLLEPNFVTRLEDRRTQMDWVV
jgi:hypothetical protein